jgi:hypothetical protein
VHVLLFAPFTAVFMLSNLLVVKKLDATFQFLLAAATLPLQTLVLSWGAVMGEDVGVMTRYDVYSVGVLLLGMGVYASAGSKMPFSFSSCYPRASRQLGRRGWGWGQADADGKRAWLLEPTNEEMGDCDRGDRLDAGS